MPPQALTRGAAAAPAVPTPPPPADDEVELPAAARDAAGTWAAFSGWLVAEAAEAGGAHPQQWPRCGGGSASATPTAQAKAMGIGVCVCVCAEGFDLGAPSTLWVTEEDSQTAGSSMAAL